MLFHDDVNIAFNWGTNPPGIGISQGGTDSHAGLRDEMRPQPGITPYRTADDGPASGWMATSRSTRRADRPPTTSGIGVFQRR